ncbi:phosphatidate cytidylyltransferase [Demequina sp. SYSU T00192]|uniref:Phosphatidate cytidylyltransferase n=1 Tax=Demequina litoralis TaxID=3051660 RepID=A0ABT8G9F0_9MICO|nr:phosphatidate cytidylyltransferase [Demequina sp. SYSU T00192]MDN4475692.1 phosphatidate cytidylyltransferase [Demequina sp. SYSU T00192]
MRWGRRQEADPDTSEHEAAPARPPFAPVNPESAAPSAPEGAWPPGLPTGEIALPGPADAAVEPPPEVAPAPHAAEQVAEAVARAESVAVPHTAGEDDAVDPVDVAVPLEGTVPAPASRAGRNLGLATVVGVVLAVGALVAAWWHPLAFAVAIYGFCIAAVIEWRNALARHGMHVSLAPVLMATVGMGVATWFGGGEGLVVALLVAAAGVAAWRIVDDRVENTLSDSLVGILTLTWIPFLGSFMLLLELADEGWKRILILIAAVVLNDTFALFTGMLFGRRKLAPRVSPKKTWEGAIGGAVFGIAGASVFATVLLDGRWWVGAAVGAAAVVAAVLGDLAESVLKRDLSVKDMSSAIPGHGGVLDRLDSMLPAAAVAYIVFALLLGTS